MFNLNKMIMESMNYSYNAKVSTCSSEQPSFMDEHLLKLYGFISDLTTVNYNLDEFLHQFSIDYTKDEVIGTEVRDQNPIALLSLDRATEQIRELLRDAAEKSNELKRIARA